ncbi:MAG: DUF4870 domain-containing protein [Actinomycetota bacterium]
MTDSPYEPPAEPAQAGGNPPAGWYPTGQGDQQYWDGQAWTPHRAPLGPQGAMQAAQAQPVGVATSDDKTMAVLSHLGGALASFIVPLIIFLMKKDESPFVRHHAAEALNLQITAFIAAFVSLILVFVLVGILLLIILPFVFFILAIIATVKASQGEWYRYPMVLHIVT